MLTETEQADLLLVGVEIRFASAFRSTGQYCAAVFSWISTGNWRIASRTSACHTRASSNSRPRSLHVSPGRTQHIGVADRREPVTLNWRVVERFLPHQFDDVYESARSRLDVVRLRRGIKGPGRPIVEPVDPHRVAAKAVRIGIDQHLLLASLDAHVLALILDQPYQCSLILLEPAARHSRPPARAQTRR